jgi:hypothetical protein
VSYTAYKYRKWDKYAKRIITHQELYFASPKVFNDLFDCQAHGIMSKYQFADAPFIITGSGQILNHPNPCALLDEATKRGVDKCGVCCFSKSYNSILMWAHYADYNRGVCFRFDLKKIEQPDRLFANVNYVKTKPIYDYCDSNADKSTWFYCKNRIWKYEREIRGLIFPPQIIKDERYRKVQFPKAALKEIIFGANFADENTYDEVICLCKEYGFRNVKFFVMQATIDSDSYKLLKVPLQIESA